MAVKINKGTITMQIPVIPLVDTVFNLLIFFLVATKVAEAEREMPILVPSATEAQALTTQPHETIITIDEKGHYFMAGQPLSLHDVDLALHLAATNNPGRVPVIIRADKRCPWDFVVATINSCRKYKIHNYRVTTREAPPSSG